jgi:hypothetical protein
MVPLISPWCQVTAAEDRPPHSADRRVLVNYLPEALTRIVVIGLAPDRGVSTKSADVAQVGQLDAQAHQLGYAADVSDVPLTAPQPVPATVAAGLGG